MTRHPLPVWPFLHAEESHSQWLPAGLQCFGHSRLQVDQLISFLNNLLQLQLQLCFHKLDLFDPLIWQAEQTKTWRPTPAAAAPWRCTSSYPVSGSDHFACLCIVCWFLRSAVYILLWKTQTGSVWLQLPENWVCHHGGRQTPSSTGDCRRSVKKFILFCSEQKEIKLSNNLTELTLYSRIQEH